MALTDYDKKNLSSNDQKKIQAATDKWNAANAKGDKAGMAAAAAEAAAVRNNAGYKTDSSGNYTGSYSSGGGSSYSGGSSGSSNKNSQYTAPSLGNTWDANTDYQSIINNAVAVGDYVTAAKAEQLRNQKITATGGHYTPSNNYSGWLDNTDYSTMGKNLMANGGSWEDVLDIYNKRYNKANGTEGLQQYANDELQNMMLQYINQQKALEQYEDKVSELEQGRPEDYQSNYDSRIDALLNEILNRDDFSYDAMNDPLYQQYADMYHREGDRAMKETMAEAAASAGGMNTYAITAAQQANSYYNSQLNDMIPQLYQLAYEMYLNDKESKVQDLGILQNMDATQYNRYRDTINDWYNDRNFAYGAYQDAVTQGNWQTNFDYNSKWDNLNFNNNEYWKNKEFDYNDMWANKEWDDKQADEEYERSQSDQEQAKAEIEWYIENGVTTISPDLIKRSGLDQTAINQMIANKQAELANKGTSSSSSGTSSSSSKNTNNNEYDGKKTGGYDNGSLSTKQIKQLQAKLGVTEDGFWGSNSQDAAGGLSADDAWEKYFGNDGGATDEGDGSVIGLGIGPVSDDLLEKLAKAGAIVGDEDGNLYWAEGWNRTNYEKRLNDFSGWGNFITLPML